VVLEVLEDERLGALLAEALAHRALLLQVLLPLREEELALAVLLSASHRPLLAALVHVLLVVLYRHHLLARVAEALQLYLIE
jgi:hypothetical protein